METTILGYIGVILGIMEKKMETTPVGSPVGFSRAFLRGFCTKRAEKKGLTRVCRKTRMA